MKQNSSGDATQQTRQSAYGHSNIARLLKFSKSLAYSYLISWADYVLPHMTPVYQVRRWDPMIEDRLIDFS